MADTNAKANAKNEVLVVLNIRIISTSTFAYRFNLAKVC